MKEYICSILIDGRKEKIEIQMMYSNISWSELKEILIDEIRIQLETENFKLLRFDNKK